MKSADKNKYMDNNEWYIRGCKDLGDYFIDNNATHLCGDEESCGYFKDTKGRWTYIYDPNRVSLTHKKEITLKQYLERNKEFVLSEKCVVKVTKVNKDQMKTQTLTRAQLIRLYSKDTCTDWRKEIESILSTAPLAWGGDHISIPQKSIDLLLNKGSAAQKLLVKAAGIILEEDKSVTLPTREVLANDGTTILCTRQGGEYEGKAFFLNSGEYNWEIKTDSNRVLCLIPTKKRISNN
jgi:hypothetical protein